MVDPLDDGRWEYHWCLKSSVPVDDEIFFIWPDLSWTGGETACGGFWGLNLQSRSPPSDLQSTAAVGPNLRKIQPQIQVPTDGVPAPILHKVLEYITSIFASLPLNKAGESLIPVGLTIRSTATPVIANNQQIATEYEVEYLDYVSDGVSPIRFSFSDDLVERASALGEGPFYFSDKPDALEFTDVRPPTNVIGALVFVGPDGDRVGSMPVSLAIPSE